MSTHAPYFGVDFGTTNSSMAWCEPQTGRAEVLRNSEGSEQTPSVVYYRDDGEVLVGKDAEDELDFLERSGDPEERAEAGQRAVRSIKRNLLDPEFIPIPGREPVRPVEVVAEILKKLKRDAEEEHFDEEIERVVITCPATFDSLQQEVLFEGAAMAGFSRVEVLEEPTAAALTVTRQAQKIGNGIIVYDLGAGTFDLSVAVRGEDGSFYIPIEPEGDPYCGGDDLDQALYDYCDAIAKEELGRPISLTGDLDLIFLRQCRSRKENLTLSETSRFSSYLSTDNGPQRFRHEVRRETFEGLVRPRIEKTIQMTTDLWNRVAGRVDAVVLIGGSSRVPLVRRRLQESLGVDPRRFAGKDFAVALGAAYRAHELWVPAPSPDPTPEPEELREYRRALESCWSDRGLTRTETEWLVNLKESELELSPALASWVERDVMGDVIEGVLASQEPAARDRYARVLALVWRDKRLEALRRVPEARLNMLLDDQVRFCEFDFADCPVSAAERKEMTEGLPWSLFVATARLARDPDLSVLNVANGLDSIADELGLSKEQAAAVEREVLGKTLEESLPDPRKEYREEVAAAWKDGRLNRAALEALAASAARLGLSRDQAGTVERSVMGDTAWGIVEENEEVNRLLKRHNITRLKVQGSGKKGRITRRDVELHIAREEKRREQERKKKAQEKTARTSTPGGRVEMSVLSGRFDAFGEDFVREARAGVERFIDSDPKWAEKEKQPALGSQVTSAVGSYEKRVRDAVQSEVRRLSPRFVAPPFSVAGSGASAEVSARKSNAAKVGAGVGLVTVFLGDPGIIGPLIGGAVGGFVGKLFGSDPKQKTLAAVEKTAREAVPLMRKEAEVYVEKVNGSLGG